MANQKPRYSHDDPSDTFICHYHQFDIWLETSVRAYITLRYDSHAFHERRQTRFVFRHTDEIRMSPTTFDLKNMEVDINELASLIDAIMAIELPQTTS